MVTSFCGISIVERLVDTNKRRTVVIAQLVINGIAVVSIFAFALAGQFFLALFAFFLFTTARESSPSLEQVWMNQNLDSSVRATLFSLRGQVNAIAQIVGGPLLGLIATGISSRIAMVATGIVLAPTLLLYARTLRNDKRMTVPDKEVQSSVDASDTYNTNTLE